MHHRTIIAVNPLPKSASPLSAPHACAIHYRARLETGDVISPELGRPAAMQRCKCQWWTRRTSLPKHAHQQDAPPCRRRSLRVSRTSKGASLLGEGLPALALGRPCTHFFHELLEPGRRSGTEATGECARGALRLVAHQVQCWHGALRLAALRLAATHQRQRWHDVWSSLRPWSPAPLHDAE